MHYIKSLFLSGVFTLSAAFTAGPGPASTQRLSTNLNVGMTLDWDPEENEMFLLQKAQACADSDTCSLEDAKSYLDDVIHIQSGCASGVLLGNDVCDNVDSVAEVVANLRVKIERESQRASLVKAGADVAGVSVGIILLSFFVAGMTAVNVDVSPFTPQEWWWAIRDGYLPTMIEHYFRIGGLATADYDAEISPFALQEWWWAIKGGYMNTMVEHYVRNGGLSTVAGYEPEATFVTPQEWLWALRDGYLPALLEKNFENGGLSSAVIDTDVLPLTPQEWIWAARDGYHDTMTEHYFRNGGL